MLGIRTLKRALLEREGAMGANDGRMLDIMGMADVLRSSGRYDNNGFGSGGSDYNMNSMDSGFADGYMYALQQAGVDMDSGAFGDRLKGRRVNNKQDHIARLQGQVERLGLPNVAPMQQQRSMAPLANQVAQVQLANKAEQAAEQEVFDDYRIFSIIKPQSLAAATQLVISRTPPRLFQMKKILISTSQPGLLRVDTFSVEGEPFFYGDSGFDSQVYGPLTTYRLDINYITQAVPIDTAITNLSATAAIVSIQIEGFFTPKSKTRRALQ